MSDNPQVTEQTVQQERNDKEYNFAQLRKQREAAMREAEEEREKSRSLQRELERIQSIFANTQNASDEDDNSEPYVDNKRLEKKLSSFERKMDEKIDKKSDEKARNLFEDYKRQEWLKSNSDFQEILEQHASTLQEKDPELAELILSMPGSSFEKQKLAYKAIKAANFHKKPEPQPTIQDRINENKRSHYYQPSGIPAAPYQTAGDFSPQGQKSAYEKVKALKENLRL